MPRCRQLELELHLRIRDLGTADLGRVLDHAMDVDASERQRQSPRRGAGEIEQIVDQSGLQLGVAVDHRQSGSDFRSHIVLFQKIGSGEQDGGERRPQFVAQDGQKLILGAARCLRGFLRGAQLLSISSAFGDVAECDNSPFASTGRLPKRTGVGQ